MKENNKSSVKALKKQLGAAVAMVCVAAIALGSSTYAWFVSNTEVTATTSTISAQSNSAFMVIKYNTSAVDSDLTADSATIDDTPLYPAQWNITDGKFETAYALKSGEATMNTDTLKTIGDGDTAVTAGYAVCNTFNISAKGADLSDLTVTGVSIGENGNTKLDTALRVLVVTKSGWVLCNEKEILADSKNGKTGNLGDTITAGSDTEVKLYVFYDGNDKEIYTNQLSDLKAASAKITVSFSATASKSTDNLN